MRAALRPLPLHEILAHVPVTVLRILAKQLGVHGPTRAELVAALLASEGARPAADITSFVAIDFETANNARESACAVAAVRVEGNRIVDRFESLIRPPPGPFLHSGIHGITESMVARAGSFRSVWPQLRRLFGGAAFLAAHNAPFDRSVLRACCTREGLEVPTLPFLCTVQVSRQQWGIYPTKLPTVCDKLGIPLSHHDALSDAVACANIVIRARQQGFAP